MKNQNRTFHRPMLRHALLTCAIAGTAFATPATKPADRPVRASVEALTAQGGAALAAADTHASADNFLDAQTLLLGDKTIPLNDPLRIATLQGLAVSYLQAGNFSRAGDLFKTGSPLDHAMVMPAISRSLLLDRAALDITQKANVMRSIKLMKEFLTVHSENDEELLNFFGTALDNASRDERYSKGPLFDQANKFYDTANAKLEAARSGERRWGITWISDSEFKTKDGEQKEKVDAYNTAATKLLAANSALNAADADVSAERTKSKYGKPNQFAQATTNYANAEKKQAAARKDADEKKAGIPSYPWLTTLAVALPESVAGTTIAMAPTPAVPKTDDASTTSNETKLKSKRKKKPAHEKESPAGEQPAGTPDVPAAPIDVPADPAPAAPKVTAHVTRYAAAFPVGPDLFITSAAAVSGAGTLSMEDSQGNAFTAELVRADDQSGLALLRVPGKQFAFLKLADSFAGGEVRCADFPTVAVFSPTPESLTGRSATLKPGDTGPIIVSFPSNPRLSGAPLTSPAGTLIGVVMAQRDSVPSQVPAVRLETLKAFLGDDAPKASGASDPSYVLMLTATK